MDEFSACEKSEIMDLRLDDYIKKLNGLTSEEYETLLRMVSKASRLAFEAGMEHERMNHYCPHTCGSAFG